MRTHAAAACGCAGSRMPIHPLDAHFSISECCFLPADGTMAAANKMRPRHVPGAARASTYTRWEAPGRDHSTSVHVKGFGPTEGDTQCPVHEIKQTSCSPPGRGDQWPAYGGYAERSRLRASSRPRRPMSRVDVCIIKVGVADICTQKNGAAELAAVELGAPLAPEP